MSLASNKAANTIAISSLIISVAALTFSIIQYREEYSDTVTLQPGALPIEVVKLGENPIELTIQNTGKSDLRYFLRVASNMGFIVESKSKPTYFDYESQIISLSKSGLPGNSFNHKLVLNTGDSGPKMNPLAYLSDPEFYFSVEVINARNGKTLFSSNCFYMFQSMPQVYALQQTLQDSSGESARQQAGCHP
ncbi:hypothetical protein ABFU49_13955 [Xanthomonas campestris pv. campestris]|uniref:hypothetical protein n=1 Tax=Xanthomonas campestris TaxID=339 RepID=UPI001A15FE74|nr:hypothetical protein [Xanthomonas campestris]MBF9171780.1 hypothetical protein [Xanthomonas campestris pv. campestris]MDO0848278.1 hypothetical protein [Xanthomonas campestris pv. campestris]MEB1415822.1 hypothetical protein [Xanthomonas campestris pv. campestris]MEB1461537.1 hypothetical protein [Xanthomonas campestris pv. campestris]MEB1502594.1 hypothetical protein [Xanthomonas campestris pv. campestris]